jgi:hypothetical protein
MSVQLTSPLVSGETYTVSFFASLSEHSAFAARFGARLSQDLSAPFDGYLMLAPEHISVPYVITDTDNWTLVSGSYVAQGGEQFLTIGSFFGDNDCDTLPAGGNYPMAYYYIDDISVSVDLTAGQPEETAPGFTLYPNPVTSLLSVNVNHSLLFQEMEILDVAGRVISQTPLQAGQDHYHLDLTDIPAGTYLFRAGPVVKHFVKD